MRLRLRSLFVETSLTTLAQNLRPKRVPFDKYLGRVLFVNVAADCYMVRTLCVRRRKFNIFCHENKNFWQKFWSKWLVLFTVSIQLCVGFVNAIWKLKGRGERGVCTQSGTEGRVRFETLKMFFTPSDHYSYCHSLQIKVMKS